MTNERLGVIAVLERSVKMFEGIVYDLRKELNFYVSNPAAVVTETEYIENLSRTIDRAEQELRRAQMRVDRARSAL